ncbi:MAG: exodeoxyribonuclease VII large subunit, partial [Fibrobacter sp.]|nr:exodeoxyribonuclease VII large subunit [Fibrobacter sp.]
RLVERAQESWTDLIEVARGIASSARDLLIESRQQLSMAATSLQQNVTSRIQGEKTKIVRMFTSLERDTRFMLREETARLDRNVEGLKQGTRKILDLAQSQFKLTELRVKSADPETALAKGYTLTLDSSGKFIRNAAQLKSGDTLRTKFRDGTVESVVQ